MRQKPPQLALQSQNQRHKQKSSPDLSVSAHTPPQFAGVNPGSSSNRSSKRLHSDDSNSSFSFGAILHSDPDAGFSQSKSKRSKLSGDTSTCGLQKSRQVGSKPTNTHITMPDIRNIDYKLSVADRTQQELKLNLVCFFNKDLDYAGVLREIILRTRQLYSDSPH
jgi:hypothetical protein